MKTTRITLALSVGALIVLALAAWLWLADPLQMRRAARPTGMLTVYSTTDTVIFAPVIEDFRQLYPEVTIRYELMDGQPLQRRFLGEARSNAVKADLLLSSAMDLQAKLVNAGYAAQHLSPNGAALPNWARWRNEAFGVTFEPAVMVFNTKVMAGRSIPRSRGALLADLRTDPAFWRGRVGTYDISRSSTGYLLASQDARLNSDFGMLMDALGDAQVVTTDNAAPLLDQIESGTLAMGYNVLGSYARRRIDQGAPLTIVYPQDYTLAVSRTALIPRGAPNPQAAHAFLDYLLSLRGQRVLSTKSRLSAIRPEIEADYRLGLAESQIGLMRPVALGPGLLVYLDESKHRRMLESWSTAISHSRPPPLEHDSGLTGRPATFTSTRTDGAVAPTRDR